jgi:hypothetical protein
MPSAKFTRDELERKVDDLKEILAALLKVIQAGDYVGKPFDLRSIISRAEAELE